MENDLSEFLRLDYSLVFQHAPVGMCTSERGAITSCNETAASLFGYEKDELLHQPVSWIVPLAINELDIKIGNEPSQIASHFERGERVLRRKNKTLFSCVVHSIPYPAAPLDVRIWTFREVQRNQGKSEQLSTREKHLATFILSRKTCKSIAREISLSVRTVEYYRKRLMPKLSVKNQAELVARLLNYNVM